jgi:hypothetical protein
MTNHIIEQVDEVDRIWFEQHPRRRWRLRPAFVGEHPPPEEFLRGIWNRRYTLVYWSRSTGRMRRWPLYFSMF